MAEVQTLTEQTYAAIADDQDADRRAWGWRRFDHRFRPRVVWRAMTRRLSREDAEDCASVVMQRMVAEAPGFYQRKQRPPNAGAFRSFLYEVTDNCVIDLKRYKGRRPQTQPYGDAQYAAVDQNCPAASLEVSEPAETDGLSASGASAASGLASHEGGSPTTTVDLTDLDTELDQVSEGVLLAIAELRRRRKPSTVQAFLLRSLKQMSWDQIAQECGISKNSAQQADARCREFMKNLLTSTDSSASTTSSQNHEPHSSSVASDPVEGSSIADPAQASQTAFSTRSSNS